MNNEDNHIVVLLLLTSRSKGERQANFFSDFETTGLRHSDSHDVVPKKFLTTDVS
jgi:hypothetical protein